MQGKLQKITGYSKFWKCRKCGNLISMLFYYVKECHDKYCKDCKDKISKDTPFKCVCGSSNNEQPIEIQLNDFEKGEDESGSSDELSNSDDTT